MTPSRFIAAPVLMTGRPVCANNAERTDVERVTIAVYTVTPFMIYHGVTMALNLKNVEVERLAAEVSRLTGESKTEAIRRALEERRRRLKGIDRRRARVLGLLERRVWPSLPSNQRGRRLTRAEEDDILGYGTSGV
jgi:antitoxin VapB